MNSIKVTSNKDIELGRTTLRADVGREPEHPALNHPETTHPPATSEVIKDVIKVSDRATTIRSLVERVGQLPEVRSDRVAQFRSLLAADAYHPDAGTIADALLKNPGH